MSKSRRFFLLPCSLRKWGLKPVSCAQMLAILSSENLVSFITRRLLRQYQLGSDSFNRTCDNFSAGYQAIFLKVSVKLDPHICMTSNNSLTISEVAWLSGSPSLRLILWLQDFSKVLSKSSLMCSFRIDWGTRLSIAQANLSRFHLIVKGCWRQEQRSCQSVALLVQSLEKQSINPKGPQSMVTPIMLMLSVLRTPCTKPMLCQAATISALLMTILLNSYSQMSVSYSSISEQKFWIRQSAIAARYFLFSIIFSQVLPFGFVCSGTAWKLPNRRKLEQVLRTIAAFYTLVIPLQRGSRITSSSAITRLRALVVGTFRPAISSEARNYRTAELKTLFPSAWRENGLNPLPFSCNQMIFPLFLIVPSVWALPSPN